jgi:hypothetical protein
VPGTRREVDYKSKRRTAMNPKRILLGVILFSLSVGSHLYAATCTNASLKGVYVISNSGFQEVTRDISPAGFVPFDLLGEEMFDGKGNLSSGSVSVSTTIPNGGPEHFTYTGTYTVNPDCTGTLSIVVTESGLPLHFDLVVAGAGELLTINTDPGAFISVYSARRIA